MMLWRIAASRPAPDPQIRVSRAWNRAIGLSRSLNCDHLQGVDVAAQGGWQDAAKGCIGRADSAVAVVNLAAVSAF